MKFSYKLGAYPVNSKFVLFLLVRGLNGKGLLQKPVCYKHTVSPRAGNLFIGFLSESLVFCEKINWWAICSKKQAIRSFAHFWWVTWAIRSLSLIFGERPERIAHGRSFLVSDLSDSLTSLIFGEWPERFTKKEGMS